MQVRSVAGLGLAGLTIGGLGRVGDGSDIGALSFSFSFDLNSRSFSVSRIGLSGCAVFFGVASGPGLGGYAFATVGRNQRKTEQRAAEAIEFGVEEIAHAARFYRPEAGGQGSRRSL